MKRALGRRGGGAAEAAGLLVKLASSPCPASARSSVFDSKSTSWRFIQQCQQQAVKGLVLLELH
ncbi:MAG: hypothetical protein Q8S56_06635, partial [Polaromonas sp.]|nr:hypothetical protein [Polaromonas sp.]